MQALFIMRRMLVPGIVRLCEEIVIDKINHKKKKTEKKKPKMK